VFLSCVAGVKGRRHRHGLFQCYAVVSGAPYDSLSDRYSLFLSCVAGVRGRRQGVFLSCVAGIGSGRHNLHLSFSAQAQETIGVYR
jgi:hypothetical protein